MSSYKELLKKYKPQINYCVVRPNKYLEEQNKKAKQRQELLRKRIEEHRQKQFAGLQDIGALQPSNKMTPINFVQKPNGKVDVQVAKKK